MPFGGLLTIGIIGAAGSLGGAALSSSAAGKASEQQIAASLKAMGYTQDQIERAIALSSNAANSSIPWITGATQDAQQMATQTGERVAGNITDAGTTAAGGMTQAGAMAAAGVDKATAEGNKTLADVLNYQNTNLDPYLTAGKQGVTSLAQAMDPGGSLAKQFSFSAEDMKADPGYQFRMAEAQKALERSQAARGGNLGGGAMKAGLILNSDLASQEYGAAYKRAAEQFNANRDFTLRGYTTLAGIGQGAVGQANAAAANFGNLSSANTINAGKYAGDAGMKTALEAGNFNTRAAETAGGVSMDAAKYAGTAGMAGTQTAANILNSAAQHQGNLITTGTQTIGNLLTGQGNAQAAGTVGSANAWNQGLSGATNSMSDILLLDWLKNQKKP